MVTIATMDNTRTIPATGPNSGTTVVPTMDILSVRGVIGIDIMLSPDSLVAV